MRITVVAVLFQACPSVKEYIQAFEKKTIAKAIISLQGNLSMQTQSDTEPELELTVESDGKIAKREIE